VEIAALEDDGRPSFQLLRNSASSECRLVFYAFDLLSLEGRRTTGLPLTERRRMLEVVLANPPSCFLYSAELR
jgi:bifunctional non-homologous end joining protein LigD